ADDRAERDRRSAVPGGELGERAFDAEADLERGSAREGGGDDPLRRDRGRWGARVLLPHRGEAEREEQVKRSEAMGLAGARAGSDDDVATEREDGRVDIG